MQLLRVRSLFSPWGNYSPKGDTENLNTSPLPGQMSDADRQLLGRLLKQGLRFSVENQFEPTERTPVGGLVRDRQFNIGRRSEKGVISFASTGMGLIGIALASNPEFGGLISHAEAVERVQWALDTAIRLPHHEQGVFPHFLDVDGLVWGDDAISTVDSTWFLIGLNWAARYLGSADLENQAMALYRRVNWMYWAHGHEDHLLRHGRHQNGSLLRCSWDRFNAETAAMYILATGAEENALPTTVWRALDPYRDPVNGICSGDLGLFAFQLSLELLDCKRYLTPITGIDLEEEEEKMVQAQLRAGPDMWGWSAGDCPEDADGNSTYKEISLSHLDSEAGHADATANPTVALASIRVAPEAVLKNTRFAVAHAESLGLMGRYGLPNFKGSRVTREMVGIDIGGTVLALANALGGQVVRNTFHSLPLVQRAIERINAA